MLSNLISATCLLARAPLGRDVCPRSSHFGTDSGCPLSYEMRRSLGGIKDVMPHLPFPCGNPGRAALCSRGHRSDGTYVLAHLTSARTAGVRCPMKCAALSAALRMSCRICRFPAGTPAEQRYARAGTARTGRMSSLISLRHGQRVSAVL